MRRIFQIIILLQYFATGVMAPVLTLALLKHGASISTVSLLLGAYSLTALVAEIPSGVFSDLCGRKNSFLLSALLAMLSCGLLLVSKTVPLLFAAMVVQGLARAFSSGSIDALAIDDTVASGGVLAKVTSRLTILESAGLASGALVGGFLPGLDAAYAGNLITNLALYILLFLLAICCVCDETRTGTAQTNKENGGYRRFGLHVKEGLSFITQKGTRILFVFSFITGFALLSVETYWQPALAELSAASWLLGVVSFAGFFSVILGSKVMGCLLVKRPNDGRILLLGLKALFGVCLLLLFFQFRTYFFIAVYMLAYFFQGGGSVVESTILNQSVSTSRRASVLSLFSFVLQLGGLAASLCGYVVSAKANFRGVWLIAGILLLFGAATFIMVFMKQRVKAKAENEAQRCEGAVEAMRLE